MSCTEEKLEKIIHFFLKFPIFHYLVLLHLYVSVCVCVFRMH